MCSVSTVMASKLAQQTKKSTIALFVDRLLVDEAVIPFLVDACLDLLDSLLQLSYKLALYLFVIVNW